MVGVDASWRRVAMWCMVAAFSVAACGEDDDDDAATTTVSEVPPVMVDLAAADGTTVDAEVGDTIVLSGGGDDVTAWTAEIADPDVVTFTPGRDDGSATFNPGLTAIGEGSTDVTVTNDASGESVSFTVDVG